VVYQGHILAYYHENFLGGLPEGNISDEDMKNFQEASDIFVGAVLMCFQIICLIR
jgi:hypothetical protein